VCRRARGSVRRCAVGASGLLGMVRGVQVLGAVGLNFAPGRVAGCVATVRGPGRPRSESGPRRRLGGRPRAWRSNGTHRGTAPRSAASAGADVGVTTACRLRLRSPRHRSIGSSRRRAPGDVRAATGGDDTVAGTAVVTIALRHPCTRRSRLRRTAVPTPEAVRTAAPSRAPQQCAKVSRFHTA